MAWRWRTSILGFVGGDLQLYEALTQLYQQEGAEVASWGTLDAPTLEYILKAVAMLSVREELVGVALGRLAPDTHAVLAQAQEATQKKLQINDFLGTEGLLLGLLAVESAAARALGEQGVDFATAETLFRDWLAECATQPDEIPAKMPFTPRANRVLELAAAQAKQQGGGQIAPEHLLLGILQEGETDGGMAMRVLEACRVDCELLKQQIGL